MNQTLEWLVKIGGPMGVMVIGLVALVRQQQGQIRDLQAKLDTEHAARLADAKANTETLLDVAEKTHTAIEHLSDMASRKPAS